jgi:uncharacterized phage infection (PIP) family protein YhgE
VPVERLPDFMQWLGYFLPSTYAAGVLRHSLTGQYDGTFWLNFLVLLIFNLTAMFYVGSKMDWRRA